VLWDTVLNELKEFGRIFTVEMPDREVERLAGFSPRGVDICQRALVKMSFER
jgi:hypothetical protein